MRFSLRSVLHCASVLVALAFVAACQDAPVAPNVRPRAASRDVSAAGAFVVINTADAGAGSLRQAVADAEAAPGADVITFAIPDTDPGCTGGTCTITLAFYLDVFDHHVTIDGTGSRIVVSGNHVTPVLISQATMSSQATVSLKFLSR